MGTETVPAFSSAPQARQYLRGTRNWGRWAGNPAAGAANLVSPEKTRAAMFLARDGRVFALSRSVNLAEAAGLDGPGRHVRKVLPRTGGGGMLVDEWPVACHGTDWTHLDALTHAWDPEGMWEGRTPPEETPGSTDMCGVEPWSGGVLTRGVLLDVPRTRGTGYVSFDRPVLPVDLEQAESRAGVRVEPGDALVVYSGRDEWEAAENTAYTGMDPDADDPRARMGLRPGLDVSCVSFIRERDCAFLLWDMMDALPSRLGLPWPVHSVLYTYGVGLIDNAHLAELAGYCAENGRYEFLLVLAPLPVVGATGCPINPLACF